MSMEDMYSMLENLPEEGRVSRNNLHVIYLARDPRAILNSVKSSADQWPERMMEPSHICSRMNNDSLVHEEHKHNKNLLIVKYEDIAHNPQEEFLRIKNSFNLSSSLFTQDIDSFIKHHNSAKWKSKTKVNVTKNSEDPIKSIMKDLAIQKKFEIETNVNTEPGDTEAKEYVDEVDDEEGSTEDTADYYDSKGKLMTVRKKRNILGFMKDLFKEKSKKKRASFEADPDGHSYYFSTYRKSTFDPDHWKLSLPR